MYFWHGQWAVMTEICACHCKHHPGEQKVIHYYSLHADASGNVAGGMLALLGVGWGAPKARCRKTGRQIMNENIKYKADVFLVVMSNNATGRVYCCVRATAIVDVWKGVSRKGRVRDNKLLVSATTSETRIHGGLCVPSGPPLPVLCC